MISGLVVIVALVFWYAEPVQEFVFDLFGLAERFMGERTVLGGSIFVILAGLSAMLAPFSSVPLVPPAVAVWGNELTLTLLMVGWLSGHAVAYLIGRFAGYVFITRFIASETIEYYRRSISSRAQFGLVFLFRLALPAEIPGYVLGSVRYNAPGYFLATFLAELPFGLIIVYASEALITDQRLAFLGWIIAGTALLLLAAYAARAYFKVRDKQ